MAECYEQKEFNAWHLEKCNGERMDYQDFCGELEQIESSEELQICINECYG